MGKCAVGLQDNVLWDNVLWDSIYGIIHYAIHGDTDIAQYPAVYYYLVLTEEVYLIQPLASRYRLVVLLNRFLPTTT